MTALKNTELRSPIETAPMTHESGAINAELAMLGAVSLKGIVAIPLRADRLNLLDDPILARQEHYFERL